MRPTRPRGPAGRRGFTLVEALTALALCVLVLVFLFAAQAALRRALGARQSPRGRDDALVTDLLRRVARDLESAAAPDGMGPPVLAVARDRNEARIEVRTAIPGPGEGDPRRFALRRVEYRWTPAGTVERTEAPWPPHTGEAQTPRRWAEGVASFEAEAWHGGAWRDAWPPDGGPELPSRVRLRIETRHGTAAEAEVWIPAGGAWSPVEG